MTGILDATRATMDDAVAAVQTAVSTMQSAMRFEWKLPNLKMPHITITGKFNLDPPQTPNFTVQWYKAGGILDGAQIFGAQNGTLLGGGEAGKEAVLPLSELWANMQALMRSVLQETRADETGLDYYTLGGLLRSGGDSIGFSDYADLFSGGGDGGGQDFSDGTPIQIVYSPEYHFEGEAPDREELVEAEKMSQAEFNTMLDQYFKDKSRKNF